MLQIIIPMAGLGSRFQTYGFKTNKFLLPINVKQQTMIEMATTTLCDSDIACKYFFIIREENGPDTNLRQILADFCEKRGFSFEIITTTVMTDGPATTVSLARDRLDMSAPVLIANSDQIMDWNSAIFLDACKSYDCCVLTYNPVMRDRSYKLEIGQYDKHSFVHIDANGKVDECREKIAISYHALVGVHYFKTAQLFFDGYAAAIDRNIRAPNGELYLSGCIQALIEDGKNVGEYNLFDHDQMQSRQKPANYYPVGEPEDYFDYLYEEELGGYKDITKNIKNQLDHTNIILFSNGISNIKYIRTSAYNIKNPGLIIFVSGCAKTIYNKRDYRKLENYEITNMDLELITECEFIMIDDKNNPNIIDKSIIQPNQYKCDLLCCDADSKQDFYLTNCPEIYVVLEGKLTINSYEQDRGDICYIPSNYIVCPKIMEPSKILKIQIGPPNGSPIILI